MGELSSGTCSAPCDLASFFPHRAVRNIPSVEPDILPLSRSGRDEQAWQ